jgi:putative addiction module antidote
MTYRQKLTKIGNSIGIVIPKDIRNLLGIGLGSEVYLEPGLDNKTIVLNSKEQKTSIDPQFFELVKDVDKQYSKALKELASK